MAPSSGSLTSIKAKRLPAIANGQHPGSRLKRPHAALTELILHAGERWMLPVLDLDPVPEPAAAIGALAMLRHHPFQPHQAGEFAAINGHPLSPATLSQFWFGALLVTARPQLAKADTAFQAHPLVND